MNRGNRSIREGPLHVLVHIVVMGDIDVCIRGYLFCYYGTVARIIPTVFPELSEMLCIILP